MLRRLIRFTFNAMAGLSALILLATVAAWGMSYKATWGVQRMGAGGFQYLAVNRGWFEQGGEKVTGWTFPPSDRGWTIHRKRAALGLAPGPWFKPVWEWEGVGLWTAHASTDDGQVHAMDWRATFPCWAVFLVFSILPAIAALRWYRRRQRTGRGFPVSVAT